MPKRDYKAEARRSTRDIDLSEAQSALNDWLREHLDDDQIDEVADLIQAAYGGGGGDDDGDAGGAMTDMARRRGRDKEPFNLSDRDEDGLPANKRYRGIEDDPPAFRGQPLTGGKMRAMDAWSRAMAADREINRRDRGRRVLESMNPDVLRIRVGF